MDENTKQQTIEVKDRKTGERVDVPIDQIVGYLVDVCGIRR